MGTFDRAEAAVRDFHQRMRLPLTTQPSLISCHNEAARDVADRVSGLGEQVRQLAAMTEDLLLLRTALALEELGEWLSAHHRGDLIAAVDGWADRAYVLFGDAVTAGLPTSPLFDEVHRSNLSKEPHPGGKPVKGPSYFPPDIRGVLQRAKLEGSTSEADGHIRH
jgi:predicted HAD superfamily Cof-like phosphohydrolase